MAYERPPKLVLVGDHHIVRGDVFVVAGSPGGRRVKIYSEETCRHEQTLSEMKRPQGIINLALINTPPEELGRMHREKLARENGASETGA